MSIRKNVPDQEGPTAHRRGGSAAQLSTLARLRQVIARVPRGKVTTYRQVAEAGGFPDAPRLTVRALQTGNGLPWHRVVAAGGRIALPGDQGQEQRLRLEIEGVTFRGARVRMETHNWIPRTPPIRRDRRRNATPRDRRKTGLRTPVPSRGTPRD
jgi:methylated-DNA-protein-cysteine methyltransferase-like protein